MSLSPEQRELLVPIATRQAARQHTPSVGPGGESCDEMGCPICNSSPEEYAEDAVDAYFGRGAFANMDPSERHYIESLLPSDDEVVELAQEYLDEAKEALR